MGNKSKRRDKPSATGKSEARIDVVEAVEVDPANEYHTKSKPTRADRKKQKRQRKKIQAEALPPQRFYRGGLLPEVTTKLHPDFDKPLTSYHRLFETDDGALFYFDSRHLSRVSPFFKDLLGLNLTGSKVSTTPDSIDADIAIPLHFATKLGLALLLHVLLFEQQPYPVLPRHIIETDFLAALVNAQDCADRLDIPWYRDVIEPHIIPTAIRLKSIQPFEALALAVLARHAQLVKEITWYTLSFPLESASTGVMRVLEDQHPALVSRLHHLHDVVKPAAIELRHAMLFEGVPGLPQGRGTELPDCRRYACAITTGFDLDPGEVSTTRRMAADAVMEGLFVEDSAGTHVATIVSRLNTCHVCNLRLSALLRALVLEFEHKYKPLC